MRGSRSKANGSGHGQGIPISKKKSTPSSYLYGHVPWKLPGHTLKSKTIPVRLFASPHRCLRRLVPSKKDCYQRYVWCLFLEHGNQLLLQISLANGTENQNTMMQQPQAKQNDAIAFHCTFSGWGTFPSPKIPSRVKPGAVGLLGVKGARLRSRIDISFCYPFWGTAAKTADIGLVCMATPGSRSRGSGFGYRKVRPFQIVLAPVSANMSVLASRCPLDMVL